MNNIINYYRKIIEKSRSLRRTDLYLILAAIAVFVLVVSSVFFRRSDQSVRIDIVISQNSGHLFGMDVINAFIQEFEDQNPGLRVYLSDSEADILFFDDSEIGSLLAGSALAPLDGAYYLPLVTFMDVFIYNIDLLQRAGRDRPPRTRTEFIAAARAVAALPGTAYPLALGLYQVDAVRNDIYPWIWAAGGDLRQDGDAVVLSRAAVDTIAFFGQLHREGLLAPGSFERSRAQRLGEFAKGDIAMMAVSSRDIPFLQSSSPFLDFGITAIPQLVQGRNRLALSGIYAGISSNSAIPGEAQAFLSFVAERKLALEETLSAVPGNVSVVFPGSYIMRDPLYLKAWDIFDAAYIVGHCPSDPLEEETGRIIMERLNEALR